MSKYFGILILVVVLTATIYLALIQDNSSEYSFPILKAKNALVSSFQRVKEGGVDKNISITKDTMVEEGGNLLTKLVDAAEGMIKDVINSIKVETFKKIKDTVNNKVDSIGQGAGINIQGITTEAFKPIIYTVKVGSTAYFTIINRENESLEYEVDWQDENQEAGAIVRGEKKVLSHKWDKRGEYFIKFKIIIIGEEKEYKVSINIFE